MEALQENAHVATFAMYHRHRAILAELAQERGVSRSALVRDLLEREQERKTRKNPAPIVVGAGS